MKILWIENGEIFGGAEMFSLDILLEWQKTDQKFSVHLLHSGKNDEFVRRVEMLQNHQNGKNFSFSHSVFSIPRLKPFSFSSIFLWWKSFLQLKKICTMHSPDIVFSNTVRGFVLQFFLFHPKKIFFAHDFTFPKAVLRIAPFFFCKAFACSHLVKKFLMKNGFDEKKIGVVENGVDAEKFVDFSFPEKIQNIGIVGRIVEWKGQKTVLEAAKILLVSYPHLHFFFFGISDSKNAAFHQGLLEMTQKFSEKNSLSQNIHFEGFVETKKALQKIDVLLHASEEAEPFGRTPVEGAMAKKFLLISELGTPAEIFSVENATFFEPKNAQNLAEKIVEMMENQKNTTQKAENAFAMVQKNFRLSCIAEKMAKELK